MLNIPIIKEWIEALRSGTYKQGKGALRPDEDCRCCLGVLCEISGKGEWLHTPYEPNFNYAYQSQYEGKGRLPLDIKRWIGLEHGDQDRLIDMNDNDVPFDQIADWLEHRIEKEKAGTV